MYLKIQLTEALFLVVQTNRVSKPAYTSLHKCFLAKYAHWNVCMCVFAQFPGFHCSSATFCLVQKFQTLRSCTSVQVFICISSYWCSFSLVFVH